MSRNLFPENQLPSQDGLVGLHPDEIRLFRGVLIAVEQVLLSWDVEDVEPFMPMLLETQQVLDFDDIAPQEICDFWSALEEVMEEAQNTDCFQRSKELLYFMEKCSPAAMAVYRMESH